MKEAKPLRSVKDINKLKNYFLERGEYRNYLLVTVGLNTALRISDILKLKWTDMFDIKNHRFRKYIELKEQKTGKTQTIYINKGIREAVEMYFVNGNMESEYIFEGRKHGPIDRVQVHRILKRACADTGIPDISCHSLRKTFGYQAWKRGAPPAILMNIYNHSSFTITKRYLGISQEDRDDIYRGIVL